MALGKVLVAVFALSKIKDFVGYLFQTADQFSNINARLSTMNDGMRTNVQLQNRIMDAANSSRASFIDMADSVGRFGANAQNAFKDTEEVIRFTELLNKSYKIAGTDAQGVAAANLQIGQALGMGVLRGQELNSVLEQAPGIARLIEKELEAPIGSVKQLGEEGKITAEVLKSALLKNADDIDKKFKQIPMTLGDIKTLLKNDFTEAFRPVLGLISQIVNSDAGRSMIAGIRSGIQMLANAMFVVFTIVKSVIDFMHRNWEIVRSILIAVGIVVLTAVVPAFTAWLIAAVKTAVATVVAFWPVILVIGAIALAVYGLMQVFDYFGVTTSDVITFIGGLFFSLFAYLYNRVMFAWNILVSFAEFMANFLIDPVYAIKKLVYDLANNFIEFARTGASAIQSFANAFVRLINGAMSKVLGPINKVREALGMSAISGISLSAPNIGGFLDNIQNSVKMPTSKENVLDFSKYKKDFKDLGEAFSTGQEWTGGKLKDISGFFSGLKDGALDFYDKLSPSGDSFGGTTPADLGAGGTSPGEKALKDLNKSNKGVEDNTAQMVEAISITNEKLDYLRDYAVKRNISNLKTEVTVNIDASGEQSRSEYDGMINDLTEAVEIAVARGRRGLGLV